MGILIRASGAVYGEYTKGMKMKIVILILFCIIGFLIGRFVVLNYKDF
jgi:hypothetical protein